MNNKKIMDAARNEWSDGYYSNVIQFTEEEPIRIEEEDGTLVGAWVSAVLYVPLGASVRQHD